MSDISLLLIESQSSSITTNTLLKLSECKILTVFCNNKHMPKLQVLDLYSNFQLTKRLTEQINWSSTIKNICFKQIIEQKIKHQINLISYLGLTPKLKTLNDYLNFLTNLDASIMDTKEYNSKIKPYEGLVSKVYFKQLYKNSFKRFNDDIINIGLNYGYSILRSLIIKIIIEKGLHPSIGINHNSTLNNYNLADDIIEVFRPLVDHIVYNNYQNYSNFSWEYRQELLKVIFLKVSYNGNINIISYVIEKFIDNLISYLNSSTEQNVSNTTLILPEIII